MNNPMKDPITPIKKAMGRFLRARRQEVGWTANALRQRTGNSHEQLVKMETGRDTVSVDTLLRVMHELGIGLYLSVQNSDAADTSVAGAYFPPPFLLIPDPKGRELFVFHWRHPAFLVHVIQTIPYDLRLLATYGPTTQEVRKHSAWEELQRFLDAHFAQATN